MDAMGIVFSSFSFFPLPMQLARVEGFSVVVFMVLSVGSCRR
jgi:hypothetical protein